MAEKNKAFYADYLADDATVFGARSPYLDSDPKVNFLPKFEQYTTMFKCDDFQMFSERVQMYGEVAVLAYKESAIIEGGQNHELLGEGDVGLRETGNTWRVVHSHESVNPGAQ